MGKINFRPADGAEQTKRFEGFRPTVYKDTEGNRTVGYGFHVDDPAVSPLIPDEIKSGKRPMTKEEADQIFPTLYERAKKDVVDELGYENLSWMSEDELNSLNDLSYNIGKPKLSEFKEMKKGVLAKDRKKIADEMENSKWFSQVGDRAKFHVNKFRGQSNDKTSVMDQQQRLKDLNFDPGPIDGIPGPKTKQAIIEFQKERGLKPDGIIGPKTLQKLFDGAKALNPFAVSEAHAGEIKKIDFKPSGESNLENIDPLKTVDLHQAQSTNTNGFKFRLTQKAEEIKFNKDDDAFSKMSKLEKFLDIVGRPSQAIKSMFANTEDRIDQKIAEMGLDPADPKSRYEAVNKLKPDIKGQFEAAWRGLHGRERHTMNELWKEYGVEGVPFLGFASEILVDPLSYTGGLIGKGISTGANLAGQGISKVPGAVALGMKVKETIKPGMDTVKKLFTNETGIPQLDGLIKKYTLERGYLQDQAFEYGVKVRKAIENISKRTGRSVDDISTEVVNLIEMPGTKPTMAATKVLSNVLRTRFANILTKEMKEGLPISSLSKTNRNIEYFPRITTKEAQQYLKQARIGDQKVWGPKLANALGRRTRDFTLAEFNDFVKLNGLESLGGRSVEEFFMKNPAYAVTIRAMRSAKSVTSHQFLKEVGDIFGQDAKNAPRFWEEAPESLKKVVPGLADKKFDPEVLGEINRVYSKVINPEEVRGFLKVYDNVQNYWKNWQLLPFAKYHVRNAVGNLWNNYLAGVTDPKHYGRAAALQTYKTTGKLINGLTKVEADQILNQAQKLGVLGRGFHATDIPQAVEEAVKPNKNVLSRRGPLFRVAKASGTALENNARLAHFLKKLDEGLPVDQAAMSVKKYLFDYSDITPFEREVMKRMAPFYTWTRKNLPLQLEVLFKNPGKFVPLAKALQSRDQDDLNSLEVADPGLVERLPVELARTDETVSYVPLEGLIPSADLAKMVRPQELLTELLSPFIKTPVELSLNKNFYTEREIERYPKETQEFLRMDVPVKLKHAMTSVLPYARLLREINNIVRKDFRKEKLSRAEQAFQLSLATVYKMNLQDLRGKALRNTKRTIDELRIAAYSARRRGREEEYKRIIKTIKDVYKELRSK